MYCFHCSKEVFGKYCSNCGLKNRNDDLEEQASSSNTKSFTDFLKDRSRKRVKTKKNSSMPKKGKVDSREVIENTIYASLARIEDGLLKQERNSRLPVIVNVNWGPFELKSAVFEKFSRYNKSFVGKKKEDYKLVYKNGDIVRYIPGTQTQFTVKRYKEDLGVGYSALIVYLVPYDEYSSGLSDDDILPAFEPLSTTDR